MFKKISRLVIALPLLLIMTACANQPVVESTTGADTQQATQDQPVSEKLALGTLMLEDTENAVTAEQAKNLLPLWKALKSLGSSETAAEGEISALYTQIEETMTAEQIQAIKDLELNPENMQALMEKYDIQGGPGGAEELTEEQRATMEARRSSGSGDAQGGGRMPGGGGMPGGGMPGGGMPGGGMPGGGEMPSGQAAGAEGTPAAMPRRAGGGVNTMMIEPVIELLTARAGA